MFKFYQSLPPIPTGHAATCCDSQREAALPSPGLKASAPPFWPQLTAADRSQWLCATPCHSVLRWQCCFRGPEGSAAASVWLSMTFDDRKNLKKPGTWGPLGTPFRWQRTHFWKAPRLRSSLSSLRALSDASVRISATGLEVGEEMPSGAIQASWKPRLDKAMKIGIRKIGSWKIGWPVKDVFYTRVGWEATNIHKMYHNLTVWHTQRRNTKTKAELSNHWTHWTWGRGSSGSSGSWADGIERNVVAPGGFWPVSWGRWHKRSGSPGSPGSLGGFVDFRGVSAPTVPLDHVARCTQLPRLDGKAKHSELGVQGIPHHPTFLLCSLPQKWNF